MSANGRHCRCGRGHNGHAQDAGIDASNRESARSSGRQQAPPDPPALASLGPFDYLATAVLVAVYAIGTSLDEGPGTSIDFYRSAATVIPTLLIAVAIQGRVLELSRQLSFRRRYRTVLLAIVVFGGEAGALMTIARDKTNWAAHLYVYLALMSLGITMLYLALAGPDRFKRKDEKD